MASKDLRDAQITFRDGATPANTLTITADEGTLTWTEPQSLNVLLNRGALAEFQDGDEAPVDVSFDFFWADYLTDAANPLPYDALRREHAAAAWQSTRPPGESYCLDVILTVQGHGAEPDEIITFEDFAKESVNPSENTERNSVSVAGKAMAVFVEKAAS